MSKLFPALYNVLMKPLEKTRFEKIRANLVGKAQGQVLEIGFGTGANFHYYRDVERVDAIEPNLDMSKHAIKQIKNAHVPIATYKAIAEELPFEDNRFDTVVATLVFCSIPYPIKALEEIRRASKPGAKFLLFEHVKIDSEAIGKTQELLTPAWKKLCDGCHLDRDTLELVKRSGFKVEKVTSYYGGLFLTIECRNAKSQ